jgi:hypothetical protein
MYNISLYLHLYYNKMKLKQKLLALHLGSPPVLGWVRVAHLFSFLCCLHPVSCVPNVVSVSGLSILHRPYGFL